MKVLVTGADGFVGHHLAARLLDKGHDVTGAVRSTRDAHSRPLPGAVRQAEFDLRDGASVNRLVAEGWEAVVHLAAIASGAEATRDPIDAWEINAVGTARLATALGHQVSGSEGPLLIVASTGEVYGADSRRPRVEIDSVVPNSPYAASKFAAEIAALEIHRRTGLRVVVTRAFAHTGPGQDDRYVVPAFAARILVAKQRKAPAIKVGRLDAVREFMHVSDVVDAYTRLLTAGVPGEIYNIASGIGFSVREIFDRLSEMLSYAPILEVDQGLVRASAIPYLVGDGAKLRAATGWTPTIGIEQTLAEVIRAQTN